MIQFIQYGIKCITHKHIYKILIHDQNVFISEKTIILVHGIE